MGYAARRLRARHARRLVARFVMTGYAFILWVVTGWGLGLSASATVAGVVLALPSAIIVVAIRIAASISAVVAAIVSAIIVIRTIPRVMAHAITAAARYV